MCVIALSPVGERVDKSTLADMWDTNPDGAGIAFIDETKTIRTYKTMDKDDFINVATATIDKYHQSSPILLHCRIATHGSVCIANTHPFNVDNHTVMAHNGIIDCVEDDPKGQISDTRMFINTWLRYLRPTWLDDPAMCEYVGDIIGWSKLAFLTTNANLRKSYYIINESDGDWIDGVWFSNKNHCTLKGVNFQFSNRSANFPDHYYYEENDDWYVSDTYVPYVTIEQSIAKHVDELHTWTSFQVTELQSLSYNDFCDLYCESFDDEVDFTKAQWDSYRVKAFSN